MLQERTIVASLVIVRKRHPALEAQWKRRTLVTHIFSQHLALVSLVKKLMHVTQLDNGTLEFSFD
jgi:K+-sensing histidine kinase KdpD